MKDFLTFTYDEPNEEAPPLWTPTTPRDTPVSIFWKPTIASSSEQAEIKQSLTVAPGIYWHDMNIVEIRVESRKAYELLHRIVPAAQEFIVRICPPELKESGNTGKREVTIFAHGEKSEFDLAAQIGDDALLSIGPEADLDLIRETVVAVFCYRAQSSAEHLAAALGAGCSIVSSDAGASEEYLARFAPPGCWHVAKTWESREWSNMILDVQGQPNKVYQTSLVDQSPYVPIWKVKK